MNGSSGGIKAIKISLLLQIKSILKTNDIATIQRNYYLTTLKLRFILEWLRLMVFLNLQCTFTKTVDLSKFRHCHALQNGSLYENYYSCHIMNYLIYLTTESYLTDQK